MSSIFKAITIAAFAVGANAALAHQTAQLTMNQNGFGKVIAQLRCTWKQSCTKPITARHNPASVRVKGKHEH